MEQAVEFIVGISFSIIGLSYLLRTGDWIGWIEYLKSKRRIGALTVGLINILLGTFIIAFHWVWAGLPLLTTLIGIICSLRGITCLLFPQILAARIRFIEPYIKITIRIAGISTLVIGLIILRSWAQTSGSGNIKKFENIIYNIGNGV